MSKKKDSIAKGGGSLVLARVLGMGFSFLLFLFLARQSTLDAGFFRTVVTYIIIAEYLGMLGMFRWLASEIAVEGKSQWPVFLATTTVSIIASAFLGLLYVGVAQSGLYSEALSQGILFAALATIPSGIFDCVQSAYVGIGKSHDMGKLNIVENLVRSFVAIVMVRLEMPVIYVIWVFVVTRWLVAMYGMYHLHQLLNASSWWPDQALIRKVVQNSPRFAVIIVAFMLVKNAAMVLLPAIKTEHEAAMFAVAYQLFDLILVAPSMLAISANNVFVTKADKSLAALKRVSMQLVGITSLLMFPLAAVTAGLAQDFLMFLYGNAYIEANYALMLLMLAAVLMMLDQVLSQIMLARRDYQSDMYSILWGGGSALVLTTLFGYVAGQTGAALALVMAILITSIVRIVLLRSIFSLRLLLLSIWRPSVAALGVLSALILLYQWPVFVAYLAIPYLWIGLAALALMGYLAIIYVIGGISLAKITRMRQFLFHH